VRRCGSGLASHSVLSSPRRPRGLHRVRKLQRPRRRARRRLEDHELPRHRVARGGLKRHIAAGAKEAHFAVAVLEEHVLDGPRVVGGKGGAGLVQDGDFGLPFVIFYFFFRLRASVLLNLPGLASNRLLPFLASSTRGGGGGGGFSRDIAPLPLSRWRP
jgi:hypothetical protein